MIRMAASLMPVSIVGPIPLYESEERFRAVAHVEDPCELLVVLSVNQKKDPKKPTRMRVMTTSGTVGWTWDDFFEAVT